MMISEVLKNSDNRICARMYIEGRNLMYPEQYPFITLEQFAHDTREWIKTIPSDFDVVVAVPRSGLIAGSMIAGVFGKPLSTPDVFANNKAAWITKSFGFHDTKTDQYNRILLVEDSVAECTEILNAKRIIKSRYPDLEVRMAAQYAQQSAVKHLNYYYKTFEDSTCAPRYDYNLAHGGDGQTAYDMDGVLCEDWNIQKDYGNFIRTALPHRIPIYKIQCIITARTENNRTITEEWLARYHVNYGRLYMRQDTSETPIAFKSRILLKEKPSKFIESDDTTARECHKKTGIKCIALDTGRIYG